MMVHMKRNWDMPLTSETVSGHNKWLSNKNGFAVSDESYNDISFELPGNPVGNIDQWISPHLHVGEPFSPSSAANLVEIRVWEQKVGYHKRNPK